MSENGAGHVAVHVFSRLARGREERPDEGGHGAREDDNAQAGLQGLLGRGLDLGRGAGVGENGAVEVYEAGLLVGLGVVEDRLQAGVISRVLNGDDRGGDLGDPLVEGELDARGIGLEVGAHAVGLLLARVSRFLLFQCTLDIDEAGEPVLKGPQVGNEAKEGVNRGHGGAIVSGGEILGLRHEDSSRHGRRAEREGGSNVKIPECLFLVKCTLANNDGTNVAYPFQKVGRRTPLGLSFPHD